MGVLEPVRNAVFGPTGHISHDEGQTAAVASVIGVETTPVNADDCFIDTESPHTAHIVVAFPSMGTEFDLPIFMERVP